MYSSVRVFHGMKSLRYAVPVTNNRAFFFERTTTTTWLIPPYMELKDIFAQFKLKSFFFVNRHNISGFV